MKKGFLVGMVILPIVAAVALFGVSKEEEEVSLRQQKEAAERIVATSAFPVAEQKSKKATPPSPTNAAAKPEKVVIAKSNETSNEDLVRKAVESVLKNGPALDHAWKKYRLELYANAGLSRQDIVDLDLLLNRYNDRHQELQDRYNGSTPEEQKNIALQMNENFKQMDQEVEAFLGPKRFKYIKEARNKFDREYSKRNKTYIETTAW